MSIDSVTRRESLQAALDLIEQGFTLFDSELRMLAWNRPFLRLLGFPARMGFVGAPFESFIRYNAERGEYGPGDTERQIAERVDAARSFTAHEFERTCLDGTVLRVRGVPVPEHGFVTLYSDITAQKAAELQIQQHAAALETRVAERTGELRRREAQMRLITDSIPALIAYVDAGRTYRYINKGYQSWFGLDPAQPESASAKEFLGAQTWAGIRTHVARAFAGEAVSFEYEVQVLGGTRLLARTTLIPDVGDDGKTVGCYELTFDITEQRKAQAMLVQAQKMEALGHLTGGLAHDFNNILTVVIGNLSALCQARPADPAITEYVDPAIEAARRGADLIKSLLSFSRKQPLEAQATEVGALIEGVGRLVKRSLPEGLQLQIQTGDVPLWAWLDAHQLQNSLLNLIFNARDASPGQGQVVLRAQACALDVGEAAALQMDPGACIRIDVQDSGSGMEAETLARVFEPFFTTKRAGSGTGLGLAMVYGFIKQSGGAIRIDTRVGAGTTVSLWLPVGDLPSDFHLPTDIAAEPVRGDQGVALLVEDDPAVRKVVRQQLLELGYAVIEAENGSEALQILDRTSGFALVLTDVVMPGGVDGRAVAAHASAHHRIPRVALMSAYAPDLNAHGDVPILAKPFTRAQLAAWLHKGVP